MLACAVNTEAAAQPFKCLNDIFRAVCGDCIEIQRHDVAADDSVCFPPATAQSAADKAADVLQIVLLTLGQFCVLRYGFHAARRCPQPFVQFGDGQGLRLPVHVFASLADGNNYLPII